MSTMFSVAHTEGRGLCAPRQTPRPELSWNVRVGVRWVTQRDVHPPGSERGQRVCAPSKGPQPRVLGGPACAATASSSAGPEALGEKTQVWCPVLPHPLSEADGFCLVHIPHPFQERVSCTTQAFKQTFGQPARPRVIGPAGLGVFQPRWWLSPEPSSSLGTGFRCFPGNLNPGVSSGSISLLQMTPPGSVPARCPCQLSLGTPRAGARVCTRTHTHTHTPINQSLSALSP